ncbi:type VII secretion-associated serine protease mycosin [Hoyosella altamirensis]|nr:type VII secretion-associated serine protease mycosin [Hoyosella altamirensis]
MHARATRIAAVLASGVIAGLLALHGVSAAAPPEVDDAYLPMPGPAAPLDLTSQREACSHGFAEPPGVVLGAPDAQQSLGFTRAWPLTQGNGQVVAVIDTGVTPHPRLGEVIPGGDYVSNGDGTDDCDAHGTFVAGLIAARPATSDDFAGVAPGAQILAIRQSSLKFSRAASTPGEYQSENSYGNVRTLAMAVRRAADLGATVINVSEVGCSPAGGNLDDRALGAALRYAVDVKDAVVVAAAGNVSSSSSCRDQNPGPDPGSASGSPDWQGISTVATPAWYDDYVLTVGSVDSDGQPSAFTLGGPWVDVAAPGTGIVSLDPRPGGTGLVNAASHGGTVTMIAGTSYAAPYVSGTVALVRERFPHLSARQTMDRIIATAHPPAHGWDPYVGFGVIDPVAAVTADLDPEGRRGSHGYALALAKRTGPPERAGAAIAAPNPPFEPDPLPRTIAAFTVLACAAVGAITLLVPSRRAD